MIKSKITTTAIFLTTLFSLNSTVFAADKVTFPNRSVEKNKTWIIKFNKELNPSTLKDCVSIKDKNNKYINVNFKLSEKKNSIIVEPPKNGYEQDKEYTLIVKDSLKALNGGNLKKGGELKFKIKHNEQSHSGGSSSGGITHDKVKFKVNVEVITSPVMPMFKGITIKSTDDSVKKYKIEDNNNMFQIGQTAITIANKDKLNIFIYNDKDEILGSTILDVSKDIKNLNLDIK